MIVRTNYSNAPATATQPASRHDDLMVIYVEDGAVKAESFDSEGRPSRVTDLVIGAEPRAPRWMARSRSRRREDQTRLRHIWRGALEKRNNGLRAEIVRRPLADALFDRFLRL